MAVSNADPIKRLGLLYDSGRLHVMARENRWVIDHYAALIKGNPYNPRNSLACFYCGLAFAADGENQQALAEVTKMPPGRDR